MITKEKENRKEKAKDQKKFYSCEYFLINI